MQLAGDGAHAHPVIQIGFYSDALFVGEVRDFVPDEHRIPWQEWVVVLDYAHNLKNKGWTKEAVVRELVTHKGMTKETAQVA